MIFRSLFIKKVSRDSEQAHAYLGMKQGGDCSHTKLPSGPQCLQINTKTEGKEKEKGGPTLNNNSLFHVPKRELAESSLRGSHQSVVRLAGQSTESPVVFYCVLIGPLAHVMHPSIADREPLLCNVFHQVDPKRDFLVVIARSKGEGDLTVSGIHHVFIPLGEIV